MNRNNVSHGSLQMHPDRRPYSTNAVVIDLGTYSIKCRLLDQPLGNAPKEIPPFIIESDKFFGEEAVKFAQRAKVKPIMSTPFDNEGMVDNIDCLKELVRRIFQKERSKDIEEGRLSIVVSEPVAEFAKVDARTRQRVAIARMLFSNLEAEAYYVAPQPVLAARNFGMNSCVVIDVGHSVTKISVVFKNNTLTAYTFISPIAGRLFGNILFKKLIEKGLNTNSDRAEIPTIKRNHLRVALTETEVRKAIKGDEEYLQSIKQQIKLRDSSLLEIDREAILIPEVLFDPSVADSGYGDDVSLPSLIRKAHSGYTIYRQLQALKNRDFDSDEAKNLFYNLVIVGGSTKIPNMRERIEMEYKKTLVNALLETEGNTDTPEEIGARIRLNTFYERNTNKRGFESFQGAEMFIRNSRNEDWVPEHAMNCEEDDIPELRTLCPR